MKRSNFQKANFNSPRTLPASIALAVAITLLHPSASAAVLIVDLRAAADFAVLAGAGITIAGAANSTTITGNIGSFATTTITGLENATLFGLNHGGDIATQLAKLDLSNAYADAAGRSPNMTFGPIFDLGGLTLGAGVYNGPSSFSINGTLTLDAAGNPHAVWIFQAGSTLITGAGSKVVLMNGAQSSNIFWQVGSSATLGTSSHMEGSILAFESISLNTGAVLAGRALAQNGAVTMGSNSIAVPELGGTLFCVVGLVTMFATRRQRLSC